MRGWHNDVMAELQHRVCSVAVFCNTAVSYFVPLHIYLLHIDLLHIDLLHIYLLHIDLLHIYLLHIYLLHIQIPFSFTSGRRSSVTHCYGLQGRSHCGKDTTFFIFPTACKLALCSNHLPTSRYREQILATKAARACS